MNNNDVVELLKKLLQRSDAVINIFIVGNIDQSNSENTSISIFGNSCNSDSDSNLEISS